MSRRTRAQRTASATAAAWTLSAFWHLLALAVLALEIHPFQIPEGPAPITVELLPPLVPETPRPSPPLKRLELAPAPVKPVRVRQAAPPIAVKPQTKPLELKAPPVVAPPSPAPEAQTPQPAAVKPVQTQRPSAPVAARALSQPLQVTAPPVPLTEPAPAPAAAPSQAAPAPAAPAPVVVQPQSEVVAHRVVPLPVLTNDRTAPGPIEIRPPDRPQGAERPSAAAGALPGGAAPGGGAAQAGGQAFDGPIAGFGHKGLRMTLGCLNQETYHLSPEEREACMQRAAREAQAAADLGPNIPPDKKAEYDRQVACREAYRGGGTPSLAEASTGTSVSGLGNVPRLRDCGPGDR
jgi:hypothetical protein